MSQESGSFSVVAILVVTGEERSDAAIVAEIVVRYCTTYELAEAFALVYANNSEVLPQDFRDAHTALESLHRASLTVRFSVERDNFAFTGEYNAKRYVKLVQKLIDGALMVVDPSHPSKFVPIPVEALHRVLDSLPD